MVTWSSSFTNNSRLLSKTRASPTPQLYNAIRICHHLSRPKDYYGEKDIMSHCSLSKLCVNSKCSQTVLDKFASCIESVRGKYSTSDHMTQVCKVK